MFTVLIAEKEHIDAIRQGNKLFFEPFLENKELAFCYWNPSGQSFEDSVPELLDTVGRRREWRAVIINNCTQMTAKMRNPFDVVDRGGIDSLAVPERQPGEQSLEEWENSWKAYFDALTEEKELVYKDALERPFQKLATWLCFRSEDYVHNDVKEKQDVQDWAMEMIGRDDLKPSVKLELLERDQYKRELRIKESLRRAFMGGKHLNIAYPTEVHCISLRSAENNYFDPDAYWTIHQDSEYSSFADRNMYFDRMRFMVFDMLSPTHRNFRSDYIRFLATVLIFVSNPIPGSAMQARRLYELETKTDDTPLCKLVTSYDRKLAATYEVIEAEMERIRSEIPGEMSDKAAEELFCASANISVQLDKSCDPEKVFTEKDYGLFFDRPENEFHKWNRDRHASEKALTYIARQQSRSVRRSVDQANIASDVSDENISRLTAMQVDDIREYADAAEDEMIASIPEDTTDISKYTQRLDEEAQAVKKIIAGRMTKKTVAVLSAVCLGLYMLCLLPFFFANVGTSRMLITAAALSLGMLGLMGIVLLVSLFSLRGSLRDAVDAYNKTAGKLLDDIQQSLKDYSKYLNAFCNVRRGHAVQNYARKNLDVYTRSLRIRKKHQEDIRRRRAYLAEDYGDFFGDRSYCDETMCRPYEYDFDETTEFPYAAPFLAGDCRQIDFISNGNYVTVPSSYVTSILVRMEEVYEK